MLSPLIQIAWFNNIFNRALALDLLLHLLALRLSKCSRDYGGEVETEDQILCIE